MTKNEANKIGLQVNVNKNTVSASKWGSGKSGTSSDNEQDTFQANDPFSSIWIISWLG